MSGVKYEGRYFSFDANYICSHCDVGLLIFLFCTMFFFLPVFSAFCSFFFRISLPMLKIILVKIQLVMEVVAILGMTVGAKVGGAL